MLFNISISSLTGIVTLGTIWNSEYLYTSGQIVLTALVVIAFIVSLSLTLFKKSKYIRSLGLFGCLLTNIGFAIYSYCHSVWITITVCLAMSLAYFMWNFIETENVI